MKRALNSSRGFIGSAQARASSSRSPFDASAAQGGRGKSKATEQNAACSRGAPAFLLGLASKIIPSLLYPTAPHRRPAAGCFLGGIEAICGGFCVTRNEVPALLLQMFCEQIMEFGCRKSRFATSPPHPGKHSSCLNHTLSFEILIVKKINVAFAAEGSSCLTKAPVQAVC